MTDEPVAIDGRERPHDAEEARAWAAARDDPIFQHEATDLEKVYGSADTETWLV